MHELNKRGASILGRTHTPHRGHREYLQRLRRFTSASRTSSTHVLRVDPPTAYHHAERRAHAPTKLNRKVDHCVERLFSRVILVIAIHPMADEPRLAPN